MLISYCLKMEHPYNLLEIVLKQHYHSRPEILEKTSKIIDEYRNNERTNYAQTLSAIYQIMSDLPSDILLYYLTTVPLPKKEEIEASDSPLPGLVKRLLVPSYHNSVRPVLLKYLNEHVPQQIPPLTPILRQNITVNPPKKYIEIHEDITAYPNKNIIPEKENVRSVIDDNIRQSKRRNTRGKARKNIAIKTYQVKPLGLICATNICKHFNFYSAKYNRIKYEALKHINDKNSQNKNLNQYQIVLKDAEKKLKWLNMFRTGHVPIEIMEEEYGNSDIFYLERRHSLNTVSSDMLEFQPDLLRSIDDLFDRLSQ